jgi:hypothetical protein
MSRKTFPLLAALLTALLIIPAAANAATGPVNVTEAPADPSSSTRFEFDEAAPSYECHVDADVNWTDCWTGYEAKHADGQQLADGQHTVQIRAKGDHSTTYTHTWTLDTTAPDAPVITSAPDASSTQTTATFEFTSEPGATFVCDLDRNPEAQSIDSCESPQSYTGLAVGQHTFMVAAIDAAGNAGRAREYTFTVTAQQPTTPTPTPTTNATKPTTPTPAALSKGKLSSHTLTKKRPVKVSFTISKPSTVTLTLTRKVKGKTKTAAKVSFRVKAGKASYTLSTKVAKRNLPKGIYTLSLRTAAGTQLSKSITEKLTVR